MRRIGIHHDIGSIIGKTHSLVMTTIQIKFNGVIQFRMRPNADSVITIYRIRIGQFDECVR